jgi:hypothetical protein
MNSYSGHNHDKRLCVCGARGGGEGGHRAFKIPCRPTFGKSNLTRRLKGIYHEMDWLRTTWQTLAGQGVGKLKWRLTEGSTVVVQKLCYGPPGLPPKYPLRRHDTPWQILKDGDSWGGGGNKAVYCLNQLTTATSPIGRKQENVLQGALYCQ